MRLKSFTAKTMTEAMQMVRDNLGEDAIILATREEDGGRSVRLSAAIEDDRVPLSQDSKPGYPSPAFEIASPTQLQRDDWLQYDDEHVHDERVIEEILEAMLFHGVPEDIIDEIIHAVEILIVEEPAIAMVGAFDQLLHFAPLPQSKSKKPLMFVGLPGAGKTLAIAKQAARAVMEGLSVSVISTDMMRAGANEQLKAFTSLLDVPFQSARSVAELKALIIQNKDKDQILIDTAGINPYNPTDITALTKFSTCTDIESILVMAAGGDVSDSIELARIFSGMGASRVIFTKMDITRRFGSILAAAIGGSLVIADASDTSAVVDGLESMSPRALTAYFFPNSFKKQKLLRNSSSNFPSTP